MSEPASQIHAALEGVFRLLVPATNALPGNSPSIELAGTRWVTTPYGRVPDAHAAISYTCISYSWGPSDAPNPLEPECSMSRRVRDVLEATLRVLHPQAIWLDALCVPPQDGASRTACLRSLGAIYGRAAQVAVVLSPESVSVLEQIVQVGRLDEATLLVLEKDDWITRAWTYQEMVNSRTVNFIAEAGGTVAADGESVLNKVGEAIESYKKTHACDSFELRRLHPRLDSLEDLIADWMTAGYLDRSAYQAMCSLDRRIARQPEDHFNAMIGAITTDIPDGEDLSLPAAEYFMRVCEAKGDFSFIYSNAPRCEAPGRRWRPVSGALPALLPWHSWGDGQTGRLHPDHLQLDNMCPTAQTAMAAGAGEFIRTWLHSDHGLPTNEELVGRILQRLGQAGFSGCAEPVELQSGYFFPQRPLDRGDAFEVFVAGGIHWVHGAPAVAVSRGRSELLRFRDVGVFVGEPPSQGRVIQVE
jgi:hypothetical protein